MSRIGWVAFSVLVANTLLACWIAWSRYSLASELDETTIGTIISAEHTSGRNVSHDFVAEYVVEGRRYTVNSGPDQGHTMTIDEHPVGSKTTIYLSSRDPAKASFVPSAGFGFALGLALLLLAVTGTIAYLVFLKR